MNANRLSRRLRWSGLTAVVMAGALLMMALTALRGDGAEMECRSALIPAYLPPDGLARIADRPVRDRVVIFNPDNGPGATLDPAYLSAVAAEQRTGTRVLGYVHTGWGARDSAAVVADLLRYRSWYGVDGVFFDETAHDAGALPYYAALARDARAAGLRIVALNPGTVPARGYFDAADIVVTFEGPYSSYAAALGSMPAWLSDVPRRKVAHLVYAADRARALRTITEGSAGFVYATDASLPNPWDRLPAYLDELETQLQGCVR